MKELKQNRTALKTTRERLKRNFDGMKQAYQYSNQMDTRLQGVAESLRTSIMEGAPVRAQVPAPQVAEVKTADEVELKQL